jgi:hypothetical protein
MRIMMKIIKSEWHQVESRYVFDIDVDTLAEIYSESTGEELDQMMKDLESGKMDISQVIDDAWENDVEIEWDHDYDDWWTSRKGGYEVTYKIDE